MSQKYKLLSNEELREKFGLVAENRPVLRLREEKVPAGLRGLIPFAEYWGVGDDLIRQDMIAQASPTVLAELKQLVLEHEDLLDEWLAGPEADDPMNLSEEYLAFSAMRQAADGL